VDVPLRDEDLVDRLAGPERDLTEAAREGAVERERDVLVDDQRAVRTELHDHVGRRQGEGLGLRERRRDERDQRRR